MQIETIARKIDPITTKPIFATLHDRVHELPENFFDFVQSECKMTADKYALYLKYPERCPAEEMQVMLKVASHLANDLKALIFRCKQAMIESKSEAHKV